jgi:hypothetical protein
MPTSASVIGLDQVVRDVAAEIYTTAHARARERMVRLERGARGRWPVGRRQPRAHSRDLFRLVDESDGQTRVKLALVNDAKDGQGTPYTLFIRSRQRGLSGKSAWVQLVRTPLRELTRQLAAETVASPTGGSDV